MVIGDGVQAIQVIVAVVRGGGIGAAAAGIGDRRLQQDAVTGLVVMIRRLFELMCGWKRLWF